MASLRRPVAAPGAVTISRGAGALNDSAEDSDVKLSGTDSVASMSVVSSVVVVSAVVSATVSLSFSSRLGWAGARLLRDLGDLERSRGLRLVGVLGPGVHLELAHHRAAQGVVRDHPLDGLLDGLLRVLLEQIGVGRGAQAAREARVPVGHLRLTLVAGERDLAGVD